MILMLGHCVTKMILLNIFSLVLGTLFCQVCLVSSFCEKIERSYGDISDSYIVEDIGLYHKCWTMENPGFNYYLELKSLNLQNRPASDGNLTIQLQLESKVIEYWSQSQLDNFTTTSSSVEIHFKVNSPRFEKGRITSFELHFLRVCGREFTEIAGNISSPGYPDTYPNDAICIYTFQIKPGYFINITFHEVNLANGTDSFRRGRVELAPVSDDKNHSRKIMIRLEGNFVPDPMISAYNYLIVFFKSGRLYGNTVKRGFYATYSAIKLPPNDCRRGDIFHCYNDTCVSWSNVCDGIKNCENGADEFDCGIARMEGVSTALKKEISWLKNNRTSSGDWHENTPRAILALFLAGDARFDGRKLEEEVMAKQLEFKTAIALLKDSLMDEQLSMFINSLLVVCHNPRQFYGQNLVQRLKDQAQSSKKFRHPIVYLTLCNAKESWPLKAIEDLNEILGSDSNDPIIRDSQAIAVMAVSCFENQTSFLKENENRNLKKYYDSIIQQFKNMQHFDGSFGNIHTTSLITQALISSGNDHTKYWNLNATVQYLIQKLASPHGILASYLTLPVLNAKSLSDVAKVNCSLNTRRSCHGGILSRCIVKSGEKGIISERFRIDGIGFYMNCWKILNPSKQHIRLQVREFNFYGKPCGQGDLRILAETGDIGVSLCGSNVSAPALNFVTDVEVRVDINEYYFSRPNNTPNFEIYFENVDRSSHSCTEINDRNGIISENYILAGRGLILQCWRILNPGRSNIRLQVQQYNFYNKPCGVGDLHIVGLEWKVFCGNKTDKTPFLKMFDVEIRLFINAHFYSKPDNKPNFKVHFEIEPDEIRRSK